MRRLLVLLPLLALAGCGTTEKSGVVGDRLDGRQVTVKLLALRDPVRARRDVTGLGAPGRGERLVGADVALCNQSGQAVIAYHFSLELDGGDRLHPRFPQSAVSPQFDSVRDGCEHGWVVFSVPKRVAPARLIYEFDDTGRASSRTSPGAGERSEHDRFSWTL